MRVDAIGDAEGTAEGTQIPHARPRLPQEGVGQARGRFTLAHDLAPRVDAPSDAPRAAQGAQVLHARARLPKKGTVTVKALVVLPPVRVLTGSYRRHVAWHLACRTLCHGHPFLNDRHRPIAAGRAAP